MNGKSAAMTIDELLLLVMLTKAFLLHLKKWAPHASMASSALASASS